MKTNNKSLKVALLIKEIIKEHNKVWGDISINFKSYKASAGYNNIYLKESTIHTIASGLVRKGDIQRVKDGLRRGEIPEERWLENEKS